MTANVVFCRSSFMGGAPFATAPPTNAAAVTWQEFTNGPGTQGNTDGTIVGAASSGSVLIAGCTGTYPNSFPNAPGVWRSLDNGNSWTFEHIADTSGGSFRAVIWTGSEFVAMTAGQGTVWTSPDGVTWTQGTKTANSYTDVALAYGNGLLLALFGGGLGSQYSYKSSNLGGSWSAFTGYESFGANYPPIVFDGSDFVVLAYNGSTTKRTVQVSPDTSAWTYYDLADQTNLPTFMTWGGIGSGLYVSWGGSYYRVGTSPSAMAADASTKFTASVVAIERITVTNENRMVLVDANGLVWTSLNEGATWVEDTVPWSSGAGLAAAALSVGANASIIFATSTGGGTNFTGLRQALC